MSQTLTREELEAVQEVWDTFAELQPEVMAQAKRLTGRTPELVPPRPISFRLADGTVVNLKGGYYPIVYDRLASRKGAELADMKDALSQVAAASRSQNTAKGFLEKRAKKVEGLAVTLTLRAAFEGLDAEIHRLAWEEWVVDSGKILKRVSPTLAEYWGPRAVGAIDEWRKDIATGEIHRLAWEEWVVDSGKILKRVSPTLAEYWGPRAVGAIDEWRKDIATGNVSQPEGLDAISRSRRYRRMAQGYCHGQCLSARGP